MLRSCERVKGIPTRHKVRLECTYCTLVFNFGKTAINWEKMLPPIQTGKSIWYGPEVENRKEEWIFTLTTDELKELEVAADSLIKASPDENFLSVELLEDMNNFKLPLIKAKIPDFIDKLHNGLGFFVWRPIPVNVWSQKQVCASFLIIGKCMGNLRQQNAMGHVLGHVKDLGLSSADPKVRVYQTSERQTFHADSADVVGLLCLKTSKTGGLSSLVSSGTMYNEILKARPDLAHELLQPLPTDKRGEVHEGTLPFYNIPVYNYYEGYLTSVYQRQYINSSQRFPEAPRLTPAQVEALDLFDSMADDPKLHFSMELQPGDMQFVHNHNLLHDRTAFVDWDEPERKRHLLRMWVATPNARPLPAVVAERFGSVKIGHRGGVAIEGVVSIAPLNP